MRHHREGRKRTVIMFDDRASLLHFILGLVAGYLLLYWVWPIYFIYEAIEWFYKRDNFVGDLCEYLLGFAFGVHFRLYIPIIPAVVG